MPSGDSSLAAVRERHAELLALPSPLKPSEWAKQFAYLSREYDPKGGKLHLWPWQLEPVDSLIRSDVRGVVMQWAGQLTGKTTTCNVAVAYFIQHRPRPMLVILETEGKAQAWSKNRFSPMVRDTPCLRGLVRRKKTEEGGESTILHKEFPGGHLSAVGSNAPSGLASRPIGFVMAEEVDRWELSAGKEGDPFQLALVRMEAFPDAVWLMNSTPLIKHASRIESEMETTDNRKWYVPCARCGFQFVMMWEHVKWPGPKNPDHPAAEHEPQNAYMLCPECRRELDDRDRISMVRAGTWKATTAFAGIRGYWLNGIVTLLPPHRGFKNRLHEMVAGFIKAKKLGPSKIQVWVNTFCAETYEVESDKATPPEVLHARRESWTLLPERCLVLTCGADVQADRIEAEIVGFGEGEETWGIEYKVFRGNTETWDVWKKFDEWIQSRFTHTNGFDLQPAIACIDANHKGKMVRAFCRRCAPRPVYPLIGRGQMGKQEKMLGGWVIQGKHRRHILAFVNTAKETIYSRTKIIDTGPGYMHFQETYELEWFKQLMSEKPVIRWVSGIPEKGFELKEMSRNEALDARVYAMAGIEVLRPNYAKIAENLKKRASTKVTENGSVIVEQKLTNPEAFTPPKPQVQANRRIIPRRAAGWMKL